MRTCVADLEGDGLLDSITKIWCGVFIDVDTEEVFKFRPHQMNEMIQFMNNCESLIMHNGLGYDFPAMKKVLGYDYPNKRVDSLVLSRLVYYNISRPKGTKAGPHSVEAWGIRFGIPKPEHEDWSYFSEDMLYRCEQDARIQLKIYKRCTNRLEQQGWPDSTIQMTHKLFEIFQKQEEYGWLIDVPRLERYINQLDRWMGLIDKVLVPNLPTKCEPLETKTSGVYNWVKTPFTKAGKYAAITKRTYEDVESTRVVGGPFSRISFRKLSIDSPKEMKDMLLDSGWEPKEFNYEKDKQTGKPLIDNSGKPVVSSPKLSPDDPFVGVEGKLGRLLAKRIQVRHRKSTLEGWRKAVRADSRMPQVVTGIAATGRLTHGGIVNVPSPDAFFGKQMRKVFTAKPGYKIVGTDAKSCQDRMLAARANSEPFTKMLLEGNKDDGTDSHSLAMHAINRVLSKHKLSLIARKVAKNFNYGWKFGASDNKLGKMALSNKGVGGEIRTALSEVFPAQAELIERLTAEWKSTAETYVNDWGKLDYRNGIISGLDGRPIFIPSEHMILVYMLQSDEAIMMQAAVCKFYAMAQKEGWEYGIDYGFVANVHDEFSVEVREELAERCAFLAEASIAWSSRLFKLSCPQEGEAAIGDNWYDVH